MTFVAVARTLTGKQKVYAAALAVAVAVLAYDKCVSPGPSPARAAVAEAVAAVVGPPSAAADGAGPAAEAAAGSPAAGLAERLRALAVDPTGDLRDAFAPPAPWAAERRADPASTGPADRDAFLAGHRLSVVLVAGRGGGGAAVVGGRLVRVGQTVDGYRLAAVGPRWARLSGPAGDVDLGMP